MVDISGTVYAYTSDRQHLRINSSTGAATKIGSVSIPGSIWGATGNAGQAQTPEPGTLILFGTAL